MALVYQPSPEEQYQEYIAAVRELNEKVSRGRSTRAVDPHQPALSEEADRIRQLRAVLRSNEGQRGDPEQDGPPDSQNSPQNDDQGLPKATTGKLVYEAPEANSESSRGIFPKVLETYSKYRPDWTETSLLPQGTGLSGSIVGNVLQEIAAPFATARDYIQGITTGKPGEPVGPREMGNIFGEPSTDWRKNVIPALVETLDEFALPLGLGRRPGPTRPITPLPKVLTPTDLDIQVAERSLTTSALETQAFPDPDLVPQVRKGTGNTLVVPSLEPGVHTETVQSEAYVMRPGEPPIPRRGSRLDLPDISTIDMYKPEYSTLKPGEYGTGPLEDLFVEWPEGASRSEYTTIRGKQMELLGGYNVTGTEPHLTGKYALTPEEQANYGMVPLREQRLTKPETSAKEQAEAQGFLARVLREPLIKPAKGKTATRWNPITDRMEQVEWYYWGGVRNKSFEQLLEEAPDPHANRPVILTPSASGKSVSVEQLPSTRFQTPEIVLPKNFTYENTIDGLSFPSRAGRIIPAAMDTLAGLNPSWKAGANIITKAYERRALESTGDIESLVDFMLEVSGRPTWMERKLSGTKGLLRWENVAVESAPRMFGLKESEMEEIYNDLYTGGRMRAKSDKTRAIADETYARVLYPASNHPGNRGLLVFNPLTGKSIPVGSPNKFMPQRPAAEITEKAIAQNKWEILYNGEGGFDNLGITLDQYIKRIVNLSKQDPEIVPFRAKGIENAKLLNFELLGGSPYQWAKKLGYETDFFVAASQYNSIARLRGELELIKDPINRLREATFGPQVAGLAKTPVQEWVDRTLDYAFMNPVGVKDVLTESGRAIRTTIRANNVMSLHFGGVMNFAQLAYPFARFGAKATVKGLMAKARPEDVELVRKSGAAFGSLMNEFSRPVGPLATFHSLTMRAYGMPLADRVSRYTAGLIANSGIKTMEREFLAHPTNPYLAKYIEELGGDPKAILHAGQIPDDMRLMMIQRGANYGAGLTDVRSIPLYGLSENPVARLVQLYWRYAQHNAGESLRLYKNAPTRTEGVARMARLFGSTFMLGTGLHELQNLLTDTIMGDEAPERERDFIHHLESVAIGMYGIPAMVITGAFDTSARATIGKMTSGIAGGTIGGLVDDLIQTMRHGPGWRSIETASRKSPYIGPLLGPYVKGHAQAEHRELIEEQQADREETGGF